MRKITKTILCLPVLTFCLGSCSSMSNFKILLKGMVANYSSYSYVGIGSGEYVATSKSNLNPNLKRKQSNAQKVNVMMLDQSFKAEYAKIQDTNKRTPLDDYNLYNYINSDNYVILGYGEKYGYIDGRSVNVSGYNQNTTSISTKAADIEMSDILFVLDKENGNIYSLTNLIRNETVEAVNRANSSGEFSISSPESFVDNNLFSKASGDEKIGVCTIKPNILQDLSNPNSFFLSFESSDPDGIRGYELTPIVKNYMNDILLCELKEDGLYYSIYTSKNVVGDLTICDRYGNTSSEMWTYKTIVNKKKETVMTYENALRYDYVNNVFYDGDSNSYINEDGDLTPYMSVETSGNDVVVPGDYNVRFYPNDYISFGDCYQIDGDPNNYILCDKEYSTHLSIVQEWDSNGQLLEEYYHDGGSTTPTKNDGNPLVYNRSFKPAQNELMYIEGVMTLYKIKWGSDGVSYALEGIEGLTTISKGYAEANYDVSKPFKSSPKYLINDEERVAFDRVKGAFVDYDTATSEASGGALFYTSI